jgi:DNA-binding HxlR family transcriptional regulator
VLGRDYDTQACSIARSLEVVGERWSLLVVRSIMLGHHRFDDILRDLGVTRSVLTARLRRLEEEGVIERRPYQSRPTRYDYLLTEKGLELWPALNALRRWGDRHYAPDGPPALIEHRGCGGEPDDHGLCDRCGDRLDARLIEARVIAPHPGHGGSRASSPRASPAAS